PHRPRAARRALSVDRTRRLLLAAAAMLPLTATVAASWGASAPLSPWSLAAFLASVAAFAVALLILPRSLGAAEAAEQLGLARARALLSGSPPRPPDGPYDPAVVEALVELDRRLLSALDGLRAARRRAEETERYEA